MTTLDALPLSAPVNLRDLAGTPVAGGTIAPGFALRSDDLATVTDADADALVVGGLSAVIDLRSREEVRLTGRGPLFARDVAYHHLPLMTSIGLASAAAARPERLPSMHELYVSRFERAAGQLVAALAIMAYSSGATAFHCSAGKDRTGVLAAALLLALGADDDTVVADYVATYRNLPAIMDRLGGYLREAFVQAGFDLDAFESDERQRVRDERAMADTLATLRARHGDPLAPLRAGGLSDPLIEALRERAVS